MPPILLSIGTVSAAEDKRGHRIVRGDKELIEKLGRNDLCPCLLLRYQHVFSEIDAD